MSSSSHNLQGKEFSGLLGVLTAAEAARDHPNVLADIEGEQETMPAHAKVDDNGNDSLSDQEHAIGQLPAQWKETMAQAAKGVTDNTHRKYLRLSEACASFLIAKKHITKQEQFLSCMPLPSSDEMMTAWIMDSCDTISLDGKPPTTPHSSYTHAQKMQASMTHVFGRVLGIGSQPWKQTTSSDGEVRVEGNPSISEKVSTYMVSLRRRKVQAGETTTSARAVTPEIMEALYDFNHQLARWDINKGMTSTRQDGPDIHRLSTRSELDTSNTHSYIQMYHIEFKPGKKIILSLPFRKTHQFGGELPVSPSSFSYLPLKLIEDIKPFVLHMLLEEEAYLCPVCALADWISASSITSGYIFQRMAAGDRPVANNTPMTSEQLLEMFHNNLVDIGIDPSPYGTHSFRRGGCQYFASI
ncbi:hypothetical protein BYT27DRAFT_7244876 [Phlegmacium glaucopus]|nr:hypothetical protein BYT27DRAFT_7244876 [Phlegmacium glaucopus]